MDNPLWSFHGDVHTNAKLRTTPEDVVKAQCISFALTKCRETPAMAREKQVSLKLGRSLHKKMEERSANTCLS